MSDGWEPGRWHRVRKPDGTLWTETSDRNEAQAEAERTGWPLERLYVNTRMEWRYENAEPAPEKTTRELAEEALLNAGFDARVIDDLLRRDGE